MRERATSIRPAQSEDRANQLQQWPHARDHVRRGTGAFACLIRPDIALRRAGINGGPPAAYLGYIKKEVGMHMIDWNK
jgi:hypothetical protein